MEYLRSYLLTQVFGPTGIYFQLSKDVHPLCIYRLVAADQLLACRVSFASENSPEALPLSQMSIASKPSRAHWMSLAIKPLLLREYSFKAQRQSELVSSKLDSN